MNRLPKGALVVKLTAILASAMMLAPQMVAAQETALQDTEPVVKTLAPLAESQQSANGEAPSLKPALQFSPATGGNYQIISPEEDAKNLLVKPKEIGSIPLEVPAAPSTKAAETPGTVAVPSQEGSAPSPVDQVLSMPATESTPSTPAPARELAASTPAPAETTAPQPLSTPESTGEDGSTGSTGQQLAQSAGSRTPTDPFYTKRPVGTGDIKIRRGFHYFPTNTIIHNLSFRDTPVKEVVAELASRGNLNVLIDKSVQGRITGNLHDVTLNEAMDSVMTASSLQARQLDNSTVVIGTLNALTALGLNRTNMRAFKLSYATPFAVANILWASVFNKGFVPDFTEALRARDIGASKEAPSSKTAEEVSRVGAAPAPGGGNQTSKSSSVSAVESSSTNESESGQEYNQTTRPDTARTLRGSVRSQQNEGTGFNSAAVDPGSETIRAVVSVTSDFSVEQNYGCAIVVPDATTGQVLVCGTPEDIQIAEEAIRIIDRRPRQVHIQSSLIEIRNEGIRQLGAALDLQGGGASSTLLGGSGAPLIQFLPGLGSIGQQITQTFTNGLTGANAFQQAITNRVSGIPPVPTSFSQTLGAATLTSLTTGNGATVPGLTDVPGPPNNGFLGFVGRALPVSPPSIAGVQAISQSQSGFNFLTLSKKAGGAANIATMPAGLNLSLNLVLQNNKAKILANPSVTVSENTEALITLADEVVHKVTTTVSLGVVSTNVELVKAGIFLNVLPRVTEDGFILLRLRPQVSAPLGGPQVFAGGSVIVTLLNVREIITQEVRVKNGQTLVIGGMFTERELSTLGKVPYLAEAPILGALFRNSVKGRTRTELMLMITPKIIEEPPPSAVTESPVPRTL